MDIYSGLTKVFNPDWSAAGYIRSAKTFAGFYNWFLQPNVLPFTNFMNEWGQILLGISLIAGLLVRYSSYFGVLLMALYYLPILAFPKVGTNSYLVDQHVIYSLLLILFNVFNVGAYWGLDGWWENRKK